MLIAVPIFIAASAFASAAISHASSRDLFAQPINIRDSYRAVWKRGWRYIGLYLVEIVAVWALPIGAWTLLVFLAALLAAVAGNAAGIILAVGAVFVIIGLVTYGIWMSIRLSLAFPATVVEQTGAWAAIKRSALLTTGTRGRIFLLYLLVTVLNWILSVAVTMPVTIAMAFIPSLNNPQHAQTASMILLFVIYGAGFAIQAFTRPVFGIALMLFYYDQRIRQEGFDIEWMMFQAGLVPPAPQPVQPDLLSEAQPSHSPEIAAPPALEAQPDPTPVPMAEELAPEPAVTAPPDASDSTAA